ncbi:MAG TPA: DUF86 domain-containing protein [Candidatus Thermoplasmatota archaeon]|nr:DUF86 domain-containing protein [Candidatus Thermoplasmatota archaeon]
MIDVEIIEAKIDIIFTNLSYLAQVKKVDKKEYLDSYEKMQATKHSLQESIEACLDIANHLISEQGWVRAETYADMFLRLNEHNIIDSELKDSLSDMARFRNLLVHRYGAIDDERVWMIIQENLDDFELFIKKIEAFIT